MDRIDAMKVFLAALDEGSLAGAGRQLGKSPAAVSRAIAFLERHVGTELLHRTTRSLKLSEAGARYAAACKRVLAELEEADVLAAGERSAPRGTLTITAPVVAGEEIVRPIVDDFMGCYPAVAVRLYLLDRPANLLDEGIDLALRLAHLSDSTLTAIKVGEVRRVVAAAPRYLSQHAKITKPADLARHQIIAMTHFGIDCWTFPPAKGTAMPRSVRFEPRLIINSIRGAVASAVAGRGVIRAFSYHLAEEVAANRLCLQLQQDEEPPLPVHLLAPQGRTQIPKVRAFVDFAVPRLRAHLARLA
jgi:DNA-binding transcriptional LysR family regulator